MSHSYRYTIAQLQANPARGERLNLAIVVFGPDGLEVHPARNLDKVRAITSALDRTVIEQAFDNLRLIDRNLIMDGQTVVEERLSTLSEMSPFCFAQHGMFFAQDADGYEVSVKRLLTQLVEPEAARSTRRPEKKTRLLSSIKNAFKSEKILARKGEGLESHRVVLNQELAEGLSVDLLLKNGAMHVVQTVDASNTDRVRRAIQEIGISALVFEQARIKFGANSTRPRLVYAASSQLEHSISPALHAAEHQGAELINWESRDDRTGFIVDMSSLAEPTDVQRRSDFGMVNASNRDKRLIN